MTVGRKTTMTLQRLTSSTDSMNAVTRTWDDKRNIKGVLTNATAYAGGEQILYDKKTVVITHMFVCKKQIGITITEKDRLKYDDKFYDIKRISNPGTLGHHLEISVQVRT